MEELELKSEIEMYERHNSRSADENMKTPFLFDGES